MWRHKIFKIDGVYGVYEAYNDGDDDFTDGRTENPIDLTAETPAELIELIGQILQDVMQDVLIVGVDEDL